LELQLLLENLTEAGIPGACEAVITVQSLANGPRAHDCLSGVRPTLSARAGRQQPIHYFFAQLRSDTGSAPLLDGMMLLLY
jgi:hypothetical protein